MIQTKVNGSILPFINKVRAVGASMKDGSLSRQLGNTARALAVTGALAGVDPYGRRWPPGMGGGRRMLGSIPFSLRVSTTSSSFTISSDLPYAHVHQSGMTIYPRRARALAFSVGGVAVFARRVTIPQRMFMPDSRYGLGTWETPIVEAIRDHLRIAIKS